MKLNLKFSALASFKLDEYIYNRIQVNVFLLKIRNKKFIFLFILFILNKGQISTLIHEELNHEFHVILTSDGNYTVLITELNKGLKDFLNQNEKENIYKLFDGLYNVNIIIINY